ncbi:MAG: ATP-binding protein [Deltaproteobacteria bacterium]|nr:ATP-binding protein [Deltaproteobacteria bacterium]
MIQRNLLDELKAHLSQREISLIIGPRQAGKTTLMFILMDYLRKRGEKTLFLSLDFESDQQFFVSQRSLMGKIELEMGKERGFVFIDEIQRKENAGLFLKGLYDSNLPYKFIVSGSGSLELKEKIHESLVGRKRLFQLGTITFDEFVNFKTDCRYQGRLPDFFAIERDRTEGMLLEYLNFGGYPRVVLASDMREKARIIDEIYRSYLERDIGFLLRVEKTEAFSALIKILASQIGMLINYSELSSTLGIALKTVKDYLWYAEKTFVVNKVTPYFRNVRKEISKSPVFYFNDLGLRNYALGLFGNLISPSEAGFVFQNLVFNILREELMFTPGRIHFWRTKDRAEVDFIIDLARRVIPVEVKFKKMKDPVIGRSLRSFVRRYQPEEAWVVNLDLRQDLRLDKTVIRFFPFFELLGGKRVLPGIRGGICNDMQ